MMKRAESQKTISFLLLTAVMLIWGITPIVSKSMLAVVEPLNLAFLNFAAAAVFLLALKLFRNRRFRFGWKDVGFFCLNALFGNILYQLSNYGALGHLSAALVTVVLAFIPLGSILMEFLLWRRNPGWRAVVFILVCIAGVSLVIGIDLSEFATGKAIGYLLAFGSVASWCVYGVVMERQTGRHSSEDLTVYQICAAALMLTPYFCTHLPARAIFDWKLILCIVFVGIVGTAVGYLLYNRALSVVGAMPCALFVNFLPIVTVVAGWLFLDENLAPLQIVGTAVVIVSACFVIWFRERDGKRDGEAADAADAAAGGKAG